MVVTLVEKYDTEWPKWFKEIKTFLGEKVSQTCIQIKHVGSTSIPGMTAKPIIDLILVIKPQGFEEIKALLAERGYYHEGDKGIKDREAFDLKAVSVNSSLPRHHLYVCSENSAELKKEIAFRDYLRQNEEYTKRLSQLKWSLAEVFNNDKEAYMEGKAELYREITKEALEQSGLR